MIKYTIEQNISCMNVLSDGLVIAQFEDTGYSSAETAAKEYVAFKQEQQRYKGIERRMKDRRLPAILREQAGFEDDHT